MQRLQGEEAKWAREEYGGAKLGDSRRNARLEVMAARALQAPSGRVSEVFSADRELQGAYDLLEGKHVTAEALMASAAQAALDRAKDEPFVFVAVDGSSLTLVDHGGKKPFGSVGRLTKGGRGLKVISALAISPGGVPVGLLEQTWWVRTHAKRQSRKAKRIANLKRKLEDKETRHWVNTIGKSAARATEANSKLWFQLDREADNRDILSALASSGHRYTARSSWDRLVESTGKDKLYLRQRLLREAPGGQYSLEVSGGPHRTARSARMVVRWANVTLRLRDRQHGTEMSLALTAVWTREEGTTPVGEKPLDWLLLTNSPVASLDHAQQVIFGYTQRWRIEDFHKTWKSGTCNVEQTQLRTPKAVVVWATILATVAVRVERLKLLARTMPDELANKELTPHELRGLILLKRENQSPRELIPDSVPTMHQAILWIAQLGGYTGKSSGGPPGSITIRRGLEKVRVAARILKAQEAELADRR